MAEPLPLLVTLDQVELPDWGWHLHDNEEVAKLTSSLHLHGQIQSLLVRELSAGRYEIIDGRVRLDILRQMNAPTVWVINVGQVSQTEAIHLAMSLELCAEVAYARLAAQVQTLKDEEVFDSLPMTTPFSRERIGYFESLLSFDWSQYSEVDEQAMLFDDEDAPPPPPRPAPVVAPAPVKVAKEAKPKEAPAPKPVVPRAPAPPPQPQAQAQGTNDAAARARARSLVAAATPAAAVSYEPPPAAPAEDILLSFLKENAAPTPVVTSRTTQVLMGSDFSLPMKSDWRPLAPPVLDGISEIELDCETDGLKWWEGHLPIGMSIRLPNGHKQYLPWGHKGGGNLDEAVVKRWAQRELRGKLITNANIKFDHHMLYAWGVDLEEQGNTLADVQHYAALLDEYRKEFKLGVLARDYLGQTKTGQELDKTRMADYHAGQVADYADHDVELVGLLKTAMLPLMREQNLDRVRQLECDVLYPVCEMERNAAHVNRAKLQEWLAQSAAELQKLLFSLAKEMGFQMNPDKNADWQRLFEFYKLPIPGYTDKGAPSFTDALLTNILHPAVQQGRRIKSLSSLRSKFLTSYANVVGQDNKLRFALHQLRGDEYGTARGRFSMSGESKGIGKFGANLQQVFRVNSQREAFGFDAGDSSHDHEIFIVRALFEAEHLETDTWPRRTLSADAQSIEYRLGAHFAKSERLIKAYQADHQQLAEGRLTDKWVDFHGVVGEFIRPHKSVTRNIVKNLNFCLVYGGGNDTAAETLGMTREQSDPIVSIWRREFPEFKALQKLAEGLAKSRGYVMTIAGRRARFPESERQFAYAAVNYVIQGSAADIMKTKLVELHKERKWTGLLMRMTVHDEVDGDAMMPETEARVREILNRQSFPEIKVPIVWEVATGDNWAEAH